MLSSTLYSVAAASAPAKTESQNSVSVDFATRATECWVEVIGSDAAAAQAGEGQRSAGNGHVYFVSWSPSCTLGMRISTQVPTSGSLVMCSP